MASREEMLFGRLAVLHGLMEEKNLDECLKTQAAGKSPRPLADIILEKGFLSNTQVANLKRLASQDLTVKRPATGPDTERFGRIALAKDWITTDQLAECLSLQRRMMGHNLHPNIGDVLVQKGYLEEDQVRLILKEQGKTLLKCPQCGSKYNVTGAEDKDKVKNLSCRRCGTALVPAGRTVVVSADEDIDVSKIKKLQKASAVAVSPILKTGDVIGGCKIESLIGQGGMSRIYKATQETLDRTVAVKVLPPYLADDKKLMNRLIKEAKALARLEHPNIVQILDFGHERNQYYMIMQFVHGKTVSTLLAEYGRLPPAESARIIKETAKALDYAHRRDILHRDIKPGNIMVMPDDFVKLLDFGLTKSTHSTTDLTTEGMVIGTVHYMSPEQAAGVPLDNRSDLYSLGATWYEMLAGKPPFEGENPWAVLLKHQNEPPEEVRSHSRKVPRKLARIVMRLLEKRAEKRYQTAGELVAAIEKARY